MMRSIGHRRGWSAVAAFMAIMAISAPAFAMAGGGASVTTSGTKSVQGAGTFVLDPVVGSSTTTTTLECTVSGAPAANVVSTAIESCVLYKGTTIVASAAPSARQTPVWVTTFRGPASLEPAGAFKVCWTVRADYDDTKQVRNSDCGSSIVPSSLNS